MLRLITDFGDVAFLACIAAVLLTRLLWLRQTPVAVAFALAIVLCSGITVLGKIAFHFSDAYFPFLGVRSPSGHVSLSTTVYGCCAILLGADKERWMRIVIWVVSAAFIAAVALSRVLLHAHTSGDVAIGLLFGACSLVLFSYCRPRGPLLPLTWQPLAAAVLVAAILVPLGRFESGAMLAKVAHRVRLMLQDRVLSRPVEHDARPVEPLTVPTETSASRMSGST